MKKLKLTLGIIVMLMISSSMVFSQTNKPTKNQNDKTTKTTSVNVDKNFVDKNQDGKCDKHQNTQTQQMQGKNFVDKNNDGICDNCGHKKADCKENTCKGKQSTEKGCGKVQSKCCGGAGGCSHKK